MNTFSCFFFGKRAKIRLCIILNSSPKHITLYVPLHEPDIYNNLNLGKEIVRDDLGKVNKNFTSAVLCLPFLTHSDCSCLTAVRY